MGISILTFQTTRRFGVEIELNSADRRDFKENPLNFIAKELPLGIHYIGSKVLENVTEKRVRVFKWHHTHNNDIWIVKPDSSCGIEVCTPILKGKYGIREVKKLIDAFSKDEKVLIDDRCSFHVHLNVSDLTKEQLASICAWWIKCESVLLDAMPIGRKTSRYCSALGISDIFQHDDLIHPGALLQKIGTHKYWTINTYHLMHNRRFTIEFRIGEDKLCKDADGAESWLIFLHHFVNRAITIGMPEQYSFNNQWTGLLWLDPLDVFKFLGFAGDYQLDNQLEKTRNWFLNRIIKNIDADLPGMRSKVGRCFAKQQIAEIKSKLEQYIQ